MAETIPRRWVRIQFLPDGAIDLFDHPNQRRWAIADGRLTLSSDKGVPTVRFGKGVAENGIMEFHGTLSLPGRPPVALSLEQFDRADISQQDNLTRIQPAGGNRQGGLDSWRPYLMVTRAFWTWAWQPKIHIGRFTSIGADVDDLDGEPQDGFRQHLSVRGICGHSGPCSRSHPPILPGATSASATTYGSAGRP